MGNEAQKNNSEIKSQDDKKSQEKETNEKKNNKEKNNNNLNTKEKNNNKEQNNNNLKTKEKINEPHPQAPKAPQVPQGPQGSKEINAENKNVKNPNNEPKKNSEQNQKIPLTFAEKIKMFQNYDKKPIQEKKPYENPPTKVFLRNILNEKRKIFDKSNKENKSTINLNPKINLDNDNIKTYFNKKIEYELNIYVYSNQGVDPFIKNLLNDFNSPLIKCQIEIIENFSFENSSKLISKFINDNKNNTFKNVVIIPIYSIYDFEQSIELKDEILYGEQNIMKHFQELYNDEQPFFLLIDYDEDDFYKEIFIVDKEFVFKRFYNSKRLNVDFDIRFQINIKKEDKNKIDILKKALLKKKKYGDDFEISINDRYFYQNFHGDETKNLESFYEAFEELNTNIFKIVLTLINQNSDFLEELIEYEKLEREIISVEFIQYTLKQERLKSFLSPYKFLDVRNFSVKRSKKSLKDQLFKYASFYNNFDELLYCEQKAYYPFKINIGICGFSGSGKSALINTILREKRCPEKEKRIEGDKINNISEYMLKDYALNFVEFPGYKKNEKDVKVSMITTKIKLEMLGLSNRKDNIHCLLFCIKYDAELNENDEVIIKIFDSIFELCTRTFIVVTQSVNPSSEEYKNFEKKIMNIIEKLKTKHQKILFENIFDNKKLELQIIPIYSHAKLNGETLGLGFDELFLSMFDYFKLKKIYYDNIGFLDDEEDEKEIQKLMNLYSLLNIFKSKDDLINIMKEKMESDANKLFMKYLILNPKSFTNITNEMVCSIYDYIFDNFIIFYKQFIDKLKEEDKLKFYKISKISRVNNNEIKNILEKPQFDKMKKGLIDIKDLINSQTIVLLSNKISSLVIEQFMDLIKEKYYVRFFEYIMLVLNEGIDDLFILAAYYKSLVAENLIKLKK